MPFGDSYLSLRAHILNQIWDDQDCHADQHQHADRRALGIVVAVEGGRPHVNARNIQTKILMAKRYDQIKDLERHVSQNDHGTESDWLEHRQNNITVNLK